MKEQYEAPEMEIVIFENDVICDSGMGHSPCPGEII